MTNSGSGESPGSGVPGWGVALIVLFVLVVLALVGVGALLYRRTQKRMDDMYQSLPDETGLGLGHQNDDDHL